MKRTRHPSPSLQKTSRNQSEERETFTERRRSVTFYRFTQVPDVNRFSAPRCISILHPFCLAVLLLGLGFITGPSTTALADPPKTAISGGKDSASTKEIEESSKPAAPKSVNWTPLVGKWDPCQFGGEGDVTFTEIKEEDEGAKSKPKRTSSEMIQLDFGDPLTGVRWDGDFPKQDYEIAMQAQRTDGFDFLLGLTFPIDDSSVTLVLGGWGGGITGISSIDDRDASENETTMYQRYENETWYDVRVRVDGFGITCWIDDEKIVEVDRGKHKFDTRVEMELCEPLGLAAFQSVSQYRDIRYRKLTDDEKAAAVAKKKEWEEDE